MAPNIGKWMRTDVDFGVPCVLYTLTLRSPLAQEFMRGLDRIDTKDLSVLESYIKGFIVRQRPQFVHTDEHLVLASMQCDPYRNQWSFLVIHPTLPKVNSMDLRQERLETCPGCLLPMPNDPHPWWIGLDNQTYCSVQCSDKAHGAVPVPTPVLKPVSEPGAWRVMKGWEV